MTTRPRAPEFIIVGTPRSGTTIVQRIASELRGVSVPPETHFFIHYYRALRKDATFPLVSDRLRTQLVSFTQLPTSRGIEFDVDWAVDYLGGKCLSPADLFTAVVRSLAGVSVLAGEKTPDHLRWWRPLTHAFPELKVVWVVRDPRAVVASNMRMPWGMNDPLLLADKWRIDQLELDDALDALGRRILEVRYEDAVRDVESTRSRIAEFLGASGETRSIDPAVLFTTREHWKAEVAKSVTTSRINSWESQLSNENLRDVERVCRRGMASHSYAPRQLPVAGTTDLLASKASDAVRLVRFRMSRRLERSWIRRQDLTAGV